MLDSKDPLDLLDMDATLQRLLCEGPEDDLEFLLDGLLDPDGVSFTPHEANLVQLLSSMQAAVVHREWIDARLIHHFNLADLVDCIVAGRRPWHLQVHDQIVDANGLVLAERGVNRTKAIIHITGQPVDDLLWP